MDYLGGDVKAVVELDEAVDESESFHGEEALAGEREGGVICKGVGEVEEFVVD